MKCLSPSLVRVEPVDKFTGEKMFVKEMFVPCGKCFNCLSNRRNEWTLRLQHESLAHKWNYFVTLTYDDMLVPRDAEGNMCFDKKQVQMWLDRLRKQVKFRYYLTCEYGEEDGCTHRPHYHALIFGPVSQKTGTAVKLNEFRSIVQDTWIPCRTSCTLSNDRRIHYLTKYCLKDEQESTFSHEDPRYPFHLMSRRPGLGISYVDRQRLAHLDLNTRSYYPDGHYRQMPRYFRGKMFTPEELQEIQDRCTQFDMLEGVQLREDRLTGRLYYDMTQSLLKRQKARAMREIRKQYGK